MEIEIFSVSAGILLTYLIISGIAMAVFVDSGIFSLESENIFVCTLEMALPFLMLSLQIAGFFLLWFFLTKSF